MRAISQIAKRFKGKIPIAVASGGSREIVTKSLEALDLKGLFDAVVTFDDVGVAKPQPDIFIEAARRLS
ncbi:HAD family hydrolase [Pseudomonas sp. NPDC087336]|uniref:HAD family hydrolase n=1 Tax=Pseudomonas sp. NPDC087336 TaxID=3364436 RepID=UPI0037F77FF2